MLAVQQIKDVKKKAKIIAAIFSQIKPVRITYYI